jgi:hypothetical protein
MTSISGGFITLMLVAISNLLKNKNKIEGAPLQETTVPQVST